MAATPPAGQAARIVLGVGGGIAAYKVAELLRRFTESGHDVVVVPTRSALRFVGGTTWTALSGKPIASDVWTDSDQVPHVRLGQSADLVVVAPATADLLARAANGLADDLLTNTLLTARCPVLFAPAMHTEMWEHPATAENVATLRRRGADRPRSRERAAHGRRHRQGTPARAGRDRADRRTAAAPSRRPALRPGRPPRRHHGGRYPRTDRPGAVPGQRIIRISRDTPLRGRSRPWRQPGHAHCRERRIARSGGRRRHSGADHGRVARRRPQGGSRRGCGRDGGRNRRFPADHDGPVQDQEVRRRRRSRSCSSRIPTSWPNWLPPAGPARYWSASRPRPVTMPETSSTTAGPNSPVRAATCSWSTRSVRGKAFGQPRQRRRHSWRRRQRGVGPAAAPRPRLRPPCGTP